MGTNVVKTQM